ncbi:MAG: hypothetical protein ACLS43_04010 [Evtepia gabavorous]
MTDRTISAPTDDGALPGPVPAGPGAAARTPVRSGRGGVAVSHSGGGIAVALVALLGRSPVLGQEIWGSGLPRDGDRGRDGFWRASFSFGVFT